MTTARTSTSTTGVTGAADAMTCKRPGCGNPLPDSARGRARLFCTDSCARRYHNDARIPVAVPPPGSEGDPLAALDALARQSAALIRAARDQASALDPAAVRAVIADAEAARRGAEAAAVTAAARQAEAESETQALTEALGAVRDSCAAAEQAAQDAHDTARQAAADLVAARSDADAQITAVRQDARQQIDGTQAETARAITERDTALDAARDTQSAADTEISRARQAETDARAETERVRADTARERDTLTLTYQAHLDGIRALTAAERARAERAETQLDTERADRKQHTSAPGEAVRGPAAGGAKSK